MISLIITVKRRSRVDLPDRTLYLFPNCVKSIPEIDGELVVTDFGSDDWPLEEWIHDLCKIPVTIVKGEGAFNRGKGLNLGVQHAKGDVLAFGDTDMLWGPHFFSTGLKAVEENKAFFPICWSYKDPEHTEGWWRTVGYGMSVVKKDWYNQVGGFPEYQHWGREDDVFHAKIRKNFPIVRPRLQEYFHQWHPHERAWKEKEII